MKRNQQHGHSPGEGTGMPQRNLNTPDIAILQRYASFFQCPICQSPMTARSHTALVCTKAHNFDRAKSGYINIMLRPVHTSYDTSMMRSRRYIYQTGFFQPVAGYIGNLLDTRINSAGLIVDAGCGEGSLLSAVLATSNNNRWQGMGIDISRDSIRIASKYNSSVLWCVADLARLPLQNGSADILLNMLAPANYTEFIRVINNDGLLVKVIPGSEYLCELRSVLYRGKPEKQVYSNDRVVRLFSSHFDIVSAQPVRYARAIREEDIQHFLHMTPLSWQIDTNAAAHSLSGLRQITVDVLILIGRKKSGE